MKTVDYIVSIVFVIALAVTSIFWGCRLDPIITIIGAVIAVAAVATTIIQHKKLKEINA